MKKHLIVIASVLSVIATCFSETKPIREFDIKTIEKLGFEIYQRDKYAAIATDLLFEKVGGPEALAEENIKGWIVIKQENKYLVRFIRQTEEGYIPAYEAVFITSGKSAFREATGALSEEEISIFHSQQLALKSIPESYSESYNTVVLPNVDGKGFLVYTLAATSNPNLIYVGGHYRMTISEDGKKVERIDRLFNSCLIIDKNDLPPGAASAGMFASHVISNTPVETHVFVSLLHNQSFFISTPDKIMWSIEEGKIKKIK